MGQIWCNSTTRSWVICSKESPRTLQWRGEWTCMTSKGVCFWILKMTPGLWGVRILRVSQIFWDWHFNMTIILFRGFKGRLNKLLDGTRLGILCQALDFGLLHFCWLYVTFKDADNMRTLKVFFCEWHLADIVQNRTVAMRLLPLYKWIGATSGRRFLWQFLHSFITDSIRIRCWTERCVFWNVLLNVRLFDARNPADFRITVYIKTQCP